MVRPTQRTRVLLFDGRGSQSRSEALTGVRHCVGRGVGLLEAERKFRKVKATANWKPCTAR